MNLWPPKDPDDVLDYSIDWSAVLAQDADTIATIVWTVPAPLAKVSQAEAGSVAVVWISGGVDGTRYPIGCRLTTVGGRTYDRTFDLLVRTA